MLRAASSSASRVYQAFSVAGAPAGRCAATHRRAHAMTTRRRRLQAIHQRQVSNSSKARRVGHNSPGGSPSSARAIQSQRPSVYLAPATRSTTSSSRPPNSGSPFGIFGWLRQACRRAYDYAISPQYRLNNRDQNAIAVANVMKGNRPTRLLPGIFDQHRVQTDTILRALDENNFPHLLSLAEANVKKWETNTESSPNHVTVTLGDWGETSQRLTNKHGIIYSILNMANAYFPGGGFNTGGGSQEEDMWARTSCTRYLFDTRSGGIPGIDFFIPAGSHDYRYSPEKSKLINGRVLMNEDELEALNKLRGTNLTHAYKIFMDTLDPEVCFRGRRRFTYVDPSEAGRSLTRPLTYGEGSYRLLEASEIFPFHECRSAALDLSPGYINVDVATGEIIEWDEDLSNRTVKLIQVNWHDSDFVKHFVDDARQRIAAQLDTLILNEQRHAVLSAFGCGAFQNNPKVIATIYKEEIEKRAHCFDHIDFAIYDEGAKSSYNFSIFSRILSGLELNQAVAPRPTTHLP